MPKEEEKGPGFSRSHMHLIPVHQWQGDNDAVKSHGRLYDVITAELALPLCCFALAERTDRNTMEAQIISCDSLLVDLYFQIFQVLHPVVLLHYLQ